MRNSALNSDTLDNPTPSRSSGYTLAQRSKIALAAILCITASLLSLMCLVGVYPLLMEQAQIPKTAAGAGRVALVLLGGLVLGALAGHILGLWAYSKPQVRNGGVPGRKLAIASVIGGIILMLVAVILSVFMSSTLAILLGAI